MKRKNRAPSKHKKRKTQRKLKLKKKRQVAENVRQNVSKFNLSRMIKLKDPKTKSSTRSKVLAAVAMDAAKRIERKKQGDK